MAWANQPQADRILRLEAIVRQALQSGELSEEAADAVYALSQASDLSPDEQRLLHILNEAITQGQVLPISPPFSTLESSLHCAPQPESVSPPYHS
jgi:hypothetical protein